MSIEEENILRLPEWCWLKGGDSDKAHPSLHKRVVLMHTPSNTILEFMRGTLTRLCDDSDFFAHQFKYISYSGAIERYCVFIIRTTIDYREFPEKIDEIVSDGIEWYRIQRKYNEISQPVLSRLVTDASVNKN